MLHAASLRFDNRQSVVQGVSAPVFDQDAVATLKPEKEVLLIIHPAWRRFAQQNAMPPSMHRSFEQHNREVKDYLKLNFPQAHQQEENFEMLLSMAQAKNLSVIIAVPCITSTLIDSQQVFVCDHYANPGYSAYIENAILDARHNKVFLLPTNDDDGKLSHNCSEPEIMREGLRSVLSHKQVYLAGGAISLCLKDAYQSFVPASANVQALADYCFDVYEDDLEELKLPEIRRELLAQHFPEVVVS